MNYIKKSLGLEKKLIMFVTALMLSLSFYGVAFADTTWSPSASDIYNTNAGNVGVGTTTPGAKLDINGKVKVIGATNEAATAGLTITSSVDTIIGKWISSRLGLYNNGSINNLSQIAMGFFGGTTYAPGAMGFITTSGASNTKGDIYFATRDVTTDTAPTERMRINSAGKVGIGKSNPTESLDVVGNIKLSGNLVSDGDICIGTCQ